jgi:hypothetical protein
MIAIIGNQLGSQHARTGTVYVRVERFLYASKFHQAYSLVVKRRQIDAVLRTIGYVSLHTG